MKRLDHVSSLLPTSLPTYTFIRSTTHNAHTPFAADPSPTPPSHPLLLPLASTPLLLRLGTLRLDVDHSVLLLLLSRRPLGALHSRQSLGYPLEKVLDVVADLGARLDKHEVVLAGLLLALLRRHLALLVQVRLVADQNDDDVVAALGAHVVDPFSRVLEGFRV